MSLLIGGSHQFTATGHYSDGTTTDLSSVATWQSSATGIATVNASGRVTAVAAGDSVVSVTHQGFSADAPVTVYEGEAIPPDPADVATPINPTTTTLLSESTQFLYTGENPIQRGVAAGAIEMRRAAVVRGRLTTRAGQPLSGARVTIGGNPQLGHTLTRLDGWYDLAVNGGGVVKVQFDKVGYLPADRLVEVPWGDFVVVPEAALVALDPLVTTIDLTSATPMQIAQSSVESDADGSRRVTMFFPQGTTAALAMPDGSIQPLSTLHVRGTEYTVGPNGPNAMPAPLPPTSAYTYAVELSVDEAIAAGARSVQFSQPIPLYVDNFLDFPVGGAVPVGHYDRVIGAWVTSDNGRVVKVVGIDGTGMAQFDIDGDDVADSAAALLAIGITSAEQQAVGGTISPAQSFWRVPVSHFSAYDINWPWQSLSGNGPNIRVGPPQVDRKKDKPSCASGSIIECEDGILGETIPIVGTGFNLNYRSDRVPDRLASRSVQVPLGQPTFTSFLDRFESSVFVAGRGFGQSAPPVAGQQHTYTWDGLDAYGRPAKGLQPAAVDVNHVFAAEFAVPATGDRSFARPGEQSLGFTTRRREVSFGRAAGVRLGVVPLAGVVGGWSLDVHHQYDTHSQTLYLGNGSRRSAGSIGRVMKTALGGGTEPIDSSPHALQAALTQPTSVVVGPDGAFYVIDVWEGLLRVSPQGIVTRLSTLDQNIDPSLAVGADGALYYSETERDGPCGDAGGEYQNVHVHRISASGADTVATTVSLPQPLDCSLGARLARAPDGTLFISAGIYLFRVPIGGEPDLLRTDPTYPIRSIVADRRGTIYLSNGRTVTRLDPHGALSHVAGLEELGSTGDGGPANEAGLGQVHALALHADGTLLISEEDPTTLIPRIRQISSEGIISTVAGGNFASGQFVEGAPAAGSGMLAIGMAVGPDGAIYAVDIDSNRVLRLVPVFGDGSDAIIRIPSEDGGELYEFDHSGRHLRTKHALTGTTLFTFNYSADGYLTGVTDGDGLTTEIERTGPRPTAIVAAFGQRTALSTDASGYLSRVTRPDDAFTELTYTSGGLLTALTDTNGGVHTFTYDALGRLAVDDNPADGTQILARTALSNGQRVTRTTAMNRVTTYDSIDLANGGEQRTITEADGTTSVLTTRLDGSVETVSPDGTQMVTRVKADPRFGSQASVGPNISITTPSGLTLTSSTTRTVALSNPQDISTLHTQTDVTVVNGRTYTTLFNAGLRTFTTTTPDGRTSSSTIDGEGRVRQIRTGTLMPVTFAYDPQGRLTTVTQGSRQSTITHDTLGRPSSRTDALARTVAFGYDAADRVTQQTLPDLRTIQFGYDNSGNVTALTPPGRPEHAFTCTPVDLTASYTPPTVPGTVATGYTFNPDSQPLTIARPDAQTTSFAYGATSGRLDTVTFSRGQLQFGYDTAGRFSTLADPGGVTLTFAYDGPLPLSETWSGGLVGSVSRTFTSNFEVHTERVNGAHDVTFGYDNDRLLTQAGALSVTRRSGDGLVSGTTLGSTTETLEYSDFGEMSRQTARVGSTTVFDLQYVRDALGRITQRTETIDGVTRVFTYGYDLAGRLETISLNGTVTTAYTYGPNDNRTSVNEGGGPVNATYDDHDRLLTYGTASYTYTANGELATKTVGMQVTTYEYDTLGNLTRVLLPNGDDITYTIDGRGRRVAKSVNGVRMKSWLYADQLRPIAELDGSGGVIARFVYGVRPNVPEYVIKSGVTYRIFSDHLGSPRIVLNAGTGVVVQRLDFTAFGEVTQDSHPQWQPFGFAGGLYDSDTGLVRFGVRDYDPTVGRWTAKDPIGFRGISANLYAYVHNDPVNLIDPHGLSAGSAAGCFLRGAMLGVAGAVVVGAAAVAAATVLSVPVVTAGLGVAAVAGALSLGFDVRSSIVAGNWDRVAYNTGAVVGGVAVGGFGGRAVAESINKVPSPPWSIKSDISQRYNPKLGSLKDWLATGPNPASAAGSVGFAGAGVGGGKAACGNSGC